MAFLNRRDFRFINFQTALFNIHDLFSWWNIKRGELNWQQNICYLNSNSGTVLFRYAKYKILLLFRKIQQINFVFTAMFHGMFVFIFTLNHDTVEKTNWAFVKQTQFLAQKSEDCFVPIIKLLKYSSRHLFN